MRRSRGEAARPGISRVLLVTLALCAAAQTVLGEPWWEMAYVPLLLVGTGWVVVDGMTREARRREHGRALTLAESVPIFALAAGAGYAAGVGYAAAPGDDGLVAWAWAIGAATTWAVIVVALVVARWWRRGVRESRERDRAGAPRFIGTAGAVAGGGCEPYCMDLDAGFSGWMDAGFSDWMDEQLSPLEQHDWRHDTRRYVEASGRWYRRLAWLPARWRITLGTRVACWRLRAKVAGWEELAETRAGAPFVPRWKARHEFGRVGEFLR